MGTGAKARYVNLGFEDTLLYHWDRAIRCLQWIKICTFIYMKGFMAFKCLVIIVVRLLASFFLGNRFQ